MLFKLFKLILVCFVLNSIVARAEDAALEYKANVKQFKSVADNLLYEMRTAGGKKNTPQAHFIKSAQAQIEDTKFDNPHDFEIIRDVFSSFKGQNLQLMDELSRLEASFNEFKNSEPAKVNKPETIRIATTPAEPTKMELFIKGLKIFFSMALGALGYLYSRVDIQAMANLLVFVFAGTTIAYLYKSSRLQKENKKLLKKDWSNLINVKTKKSLKQAFDSMDNIFICQVDRTDKIIFSNMAFEKAFGKCSDWVQFFSENFKSEKNLRGVSSVYRRVSDVASDYFINIGSPNESGIKTIFMHKLDSVLLTKVADSRKVVLEKNKTSAIDLLENSITSQSSFSNNNNIVISETDYAESLFVYLPEEQAQLLFDQYVRSIRAIARLKGCQENIEIKSHRNEGKFCLIAFMPDISLHSRDFSQSVPFGGKMHDLGTALKEINQIVKDHEVSLVIKNIESTAKNGVHFEMVMADLDRIQTGAFEFTL